ncbi:MAG: gliding motility-associated C-terminal domain-containing protein, partial [Crocinitomicaceae bacterium]
IDSILVKDAISVIPVPIADFSFTPENPTLSSPEVRFKNLSSSAENFEWNFGDNTTSTELDPVHNYPELGQSYTVSLIAMDANSTCENEYSQTLVVQDEVLFFIPNTFTPDGTGKNDFFKPVFISGINVYKFKFQVFNRFGELIFESFDPEGYWDGEYGGQTVQEGAYIWKLDFVETMVDQPHTHIGSVNVLR